jgi:phospholipase D1/2
MRDRLIGEHLGVDADTIGREYDRFGSLRAVIDAHAHGDRTLLPIEPVEDLEEPTDAMREAADPAEPAGFGPEIDRLLPALDVNQARSHLRLWIVPAIVVFAAAIVGWSSDPGAPSFLRELRSMVASMGTDWPAIGIGAAGFVICAWLLVPVELLVLVAAVAFGPVKGAAVSTIGSVGAAVSGYIAGRALGPSVVMQWLGPRTYRMGRQLCAPGPAAIAAMRLATIATASSVHLLCGAGKVRLRDYLVGSIAGLVPPVVALSVLGGLLRSTLLAPTVWNALLTIGFALLLAGAAFAIRMSLLIRQFAPVTAGHQSRAEFG